MDGRIWIHAFFGADVAQLHVLTWLQQTWSVRRARKVADKVKMLSLVGGDGERLLHQTVRLVTVAVWTTAIIFWFRCSIHAVAIGALVKAGSTSLSLHLAIR